MRRWTPYIAMLGLLLAFRWCGLKLEGWPMNFQPVAALAFCALALVPKRDRVPAVVVCVLAWIAVFPLLNWKLGFAPSAALIGTIAGLLAVFGVGWLFRSSRSVGKILSGVSLAALAFYLVTNTFSFFQLVHLYPRSLEGFIQAQWTGPVGFGPTWVFLRNAIGANLIFTSLFFVATRVTASEEEPEPEDDEVEVPAEA